LLHYSHTEARNLLLIAGFTHDDVAAQTLTFFVDGYETSSTAMAFGLYCLAVNPDVQTKVRDEVDSVLKKYGGELTFEGIQEMAYLDMALSGKIIQITIKYSKFKVSTGSLPIRPLLHTVYSRLSGCGLLR
jgi:hypothetical protein